MIYRINEEEKINKLLNYIGSNYYKCIYLYLDLKKYGISNPNVKAWIQEDDNKEILCVILKYYTGMHIYSEKHNYNLKEISDLITVENPTMICGEQKSIEDIYEFMSNNDYKIEKGWVRGLAKMDKNIYNEVRKAEKEDFNQIAKLLYEDEDLGSSYQLEELKEQLYERNKEGYVRNYVIKQNERVISHAATGAEDEKLGMLAYVITDPQYRGKGNAQKVCETVCQELIEEGKKVFLINYSNESTALYDKIGFQVCCNWAKMYLDLKK